MNGRSGARPSPAARTLTNRASGKVVEVAVAAPADGGDAVQWADNGGLHQKWSIVPLGNGADVVQRTATGATRQQWSLS
ncbi:RICIN domain-containing protein [Micromonospora sp. NPDC049044]|uniref:RICIN domain-containing protein n=1 Tax=unclassified Micromonospora TaxID=2617518 RepID=UPI0033DC40B3